MLLESLRSGYISFSDIHREQQRAGEIVEIDLVAPLLLGQAPQALTVAAGCYSDDALRSVS